MMSACATDSQPHASFSVERRGRLVWNVVGALCLRPSGYSERGTGRPIVARRLREHRWCTALGTNRRRGQIPRPAPTGLSRGQASACGGSIRNSHLTATAHGFAARYTKSTRRVPEVRDRQSHRVGSASCALPLPDRPRARGGPGREQRRVLPAKRPTTSMPRMTAARSISPNRARYGLQVQPPYEGWQCYRRPLLEWGSMAISAT